MLSPGTHHRHLSRDLVENLRQRRALLDLAENNPRVQKQLIQMCKEDVVFWWNAFVWQFNPSKASRGAEAVAPFILFPFQERALLARPETDKQFSPYDRGILWCYEHSKTMACEKSRWQGASWLFLGVQVWLAGFHEYSQMLNISRNEDAVDDGSKNSLFWKIRYILDRQPVWLMGRRLPSHSTRIKVPGEIEDTKLYFHFHRTDAEITGEASTAKAGVGGRASVIFVDEYPEIERAQEIREKTALTADCRFFNGTHLGVGTPFQKMCDPKQSPEIVRWRMHWTDHPEQSRGLYEFDPQRPTQPIVHDKQYAFPDDFRFVLDGSPVGGPRPGVRSPWYDRKCVEMGDPRAVAMNLDISPEGAARQFFDGLKVRNYISEVCRPPVWVGDILTDPNGRLRSIYHDPKGKLKLWIHPKGDGLFPAGRYAIGCDVSAGTGATPSCAAVGNIDLGTKVAEYANAGPGFPEPDFARVVRGLCDLAADESGQGAYLVWDNSGQQGTKFEQAILELGYRNIYYDESDKIQFARKGPQRPGWFGNTKQKYAALVDYREGLYARRVVDRSEACLLETLLFEYDKATKKVAHSGEIRSNDPSGARENHGDLVVATMLMWMLMKEWAEGGRKERREKERAEPGTLGWIEKLQEMRQRHLEEAF